MGGSTAPKTPTPSESAQAQALSQLAGQMFETGTKPTMTYSEVLSRLESDPTYEKINAANNARSGLHNAQAQQANDAATNPYGAAIRNMQAKSAAGRLASVLGQPVAAGLTPTNTKGIYDYPTSADLPSLEDINAQSQAITKSLPQVSVSNDQVSLNYPGTSGYAGLEDSIRRALGEAPKAQSTGAPSTSGAQPGIQGFRYDPNTNTYVPVGSTNTNQANWYGYTSGRN